MKEDVTLRHNAGKNKLELIPWEWVVELGKVFTFGAIKYAAWNWTKSVNTQDHDNLREDRMGSALRHFYAYRSGETNDPESGAHHLAHAAWNLLTVMWYDLNKK